MRQLNNRKLKLFFLCKNSKKRKKWMTVVLISLDIVGPIIWEGLELK